MEPGPVEDLGTCPALESVQLKQCQLRDKQGLKALFTVCATAREIAFKDCWGLDNDMFSTTSICRYFGFICHFNFNFILLISFLLRNVEFEPTIS